MRQFGVVLLAVAMVFGLTAVVVAEDAKPVRVAGQISKIEGKAVTITATVDNATKDTVITCNDATKYRRDGAPGSAPSNAKFEDLQVGQQVRAYYTAADKIATTIIIANAPPAKATK